MIIPINAFFIVDSLVQNWTTSYRQMLKWLQGGKLTPQDSTMLHGIAMQCSDEYGDVIHVARAILGQYNDVNYDTYNDCNTSNQSQTVPRSAEVIAYAQNISIQPNPSSGTFLVDFAEEYSGKVEVYTLQGKLLTSSLYHKASYTSIVVDNYNGIVIVRVQHVGQSPLVRRAIILQ